MVLNQISIENNSFKKLLFYLSLTLFLVISSFDYLFGLQTYKFKYGDTLWDLAAKFYGDPRLYPVFLEINDISNPRRIPTGKIILVPTLDELRKIQNEPDPYKRKEMIQNIKSGNTDNSSSQPSNPPSNQAKQNSESSNNNNNSNSQNSSNNSEPIDTSQVKMINIFEGSVTNINHSNQIDTPPDSGR